MNKYKKMKKMCVYGAILLLVGSAFSLQAQDSVYMSNEFAKAVAIYQRAQRYNDEQISKQALIEMSVLNPRDTAVLRNLAEIYYQEGRYVSTALVSQDILSLVPNNLFALELSALSYENLRLYDKAIENYEPIWLKTEDSSVLYQISYLQFITERFDEATGNIDILETKVEDDEEITLSKNNGDLQKVKFKAALANMRGLIAQNRGNMEDALKHFEIAVALSPDFEAAVTNLTEAKK